jgi:urease accessory protein
MRCAILTTLITAFVFAPVIALAHTGHGEANGLMHGLIHPITGIDHVLVMVAVGALAARIGGRALWLVPLSFVGVIVVAGILGMAGIQVPIAEAGIALSVVVLGLAIAVRIKLPVLAAIALVGFFAVFHGYIHGAEMPAVASGLLYAIGFVTATMLLNTVGLGLGLLTRHDGATLSRRLVQAGGGAMALFGIAVLATFLP